MSSFFFLTKKLNKIKETVEKKETEILEVKKSKSNFDQESQSKLNTVFSNVRTDFLSIKILEGTFKNSINTKIGFFKSFIIGTDEFKIRRKLGKQLDVANKDLEDALVLINQASIALRKE